MEFLLREPQPLLQLTGPDGGPSSPVSARKVLVVEDAEENAKSLCLHLEEQGFVPYWASKGTHAVAAARKVQPDAIVLDIGLPDLDGAEVHRLLRAHPATRHVPVVAWTTATDPRIEAVFLRDETADYVVKGVTGMASVPARINRLLNRQGATPGTDGHLERGRVKLDTGQRCVWVRGKLVCENLGPKRLSVLRILLEREGPVSRKDLYDAVWNGDEDPRIVDKTVSRLREDLGIKEGEVILSRSGSYQLVG